MRYLKFNYKILESEINDIVEKCEKYNIDKYEIDDDLLLIVCESVDLRNKKIKKQLPLEFKEVWVILS